MELWGKLQLCLIQSFALKNGDFGELVEPQGPLEYSALMMLANIMTQQEGAMLRDPKTVDYLFREAVALQKAGVAFKFSDVAALVDASFKTQLQMQENQADLLFAEMHAKNQFSQINLRQQTLPNVLKLFRGFLAMDAKVISPANRQIAIDSFCEYVNSDVTLGMSNSLWLTIVDVCNRANEASPKLKETGEMAKERFNVDFDHDLLRTDLRKEDHEPATGRRVKRRA